MSEKLCVFCKHFDWSEIEEYQLSEYTGGIEGGMSCNKGVYRDERPCDTDDFRRAVLTAEKCDLYEPDKLPNSSTPYYSPSAYSALQGR